LELEGSLDLSRTPVSKKYSKQQLKDMLPGVKGNIFV
jgi:hypothetical protein